VRERTTGSRGRRSQTGALWRGMWGWRGWSGRFSQAAGLGFEESDGGCGRGRDGMSQRGGRPPFTPASLARLLHGPRRLFGCPTSATAGFKRTWDLVASRAGLSLPCSNQSTAVVQACELQTDWPHSRLCHSRSCLGCDLIVATSAVSWVVLLASLYCQL